MAELGAPYEQLWRLLSTRFVEHGEQLIAETLSEALGTVPPAPRGPSTPTTTVPAAMQRYQVESTPSAPSGGKSVGRSLVQSTRDSITSS